MFKDFLPDYLVLIDIHKKEYFTEKIITFFFEFCHFLFVQGGVLDIPEISPNTDHIVSIGGWGETEEGLK